MKQGVLGQLSIVVVCAASVVSTSGNAATWRIKPSVDASVTYTDNVSLAPSGSETNDLVYQVNPGVSIAGRGRRLKLDFNYRMQNVGFKDNSSQNDMFHQLDSSANVELLRNFFYLDVTGQYAQQSVNNTGVISSDNLVINSNTTNVASIQINPYLKKRFGNFSEVRLDYSYSDVRYKDSNADSNDSTAALQVKSGKAFTRLDWQFDATRTEINPDDRPDSSFQNYLASVGYAVTRRLRTYISLGYDDNEYVTAPGVDTPEGDYWSAGITWRPTRRTVLDLSGSKRYFGDTVTVKFTHYTRRSTWNASYSEDVTNLQLQELSRNVFTTQDPFGNPVTDIGLPQTLDPSLPSITSDIYIRKRFDAGFGYKTAKSIFDIGVFNEERQFQTSLNEEKVYGLDGKWTWNVKPRTKIIFAGYAQVLENAANLKDGFGQVSATIQRKMSRKMTGSLAISHSRRDASNNLVDSRSNLITGNINIAF